MRKYKTKEERIKALLMAAAYATDPRNSATTVGKQFGVGHKKVIEAAHEYGVYEKKRRTKAELARAAQPEQDHDEPSESTLFDGVREEQTHNANTETETTKEHVPNKNRFLLLFERINLLTAQVEALEEKHKHIRRIINEIEFRLDEPEQEPEQEPEPDVSDLFTSDETPAFCGVGDPLYATLR